MGFIATQVRLFIFALQRFGCVRASVEPTSGAVAQRHAIRYWPLVGLLVGTLCGLIYFIVARWFPPAVSILLALGAGLLLTRAVHERELYRTGEWLATGAGAILVSLLLLLQFATLAYQRESALLIAFLCGHSFSRFAVLPLIVSFHSPELKPDPSRAPSIRFGEFLCAAFWGLLPLVAVISNRTLESQLHAPLLIGAGAALAAAALLGALLYRRFGYISGEGLGAVQQCAAIAFYLGLLVSPR